MLPNSTDLTSAEMKTELLNALCSNFDEIMRKTVAVSSINLMTKVARLQRDEQWIGSIVHPVAVVQLQSTN